MNPSENDGGAIDVKGGATESVPKVSKISCLIHSGLVSSYNGSCEGIHLYSRSIHGVYHTLQNIIFRLFLLWSWSFLLVRMLHVLADSMQVFTLAQL